LRSPWREPSGKKDAPSFGRGKAGAKAGRAFNDASIPKDLGVAKKRRAGGKAGGDAGSRRAPLPHLRFLLLCITCVSLSGCLT